MFFLAFTGTLESKVGQRIKNICQALDSILFEVPKDRNFIENAIKDARKDLRDNQTVFSKSFREIEKISDKLSEIRDGFESSYIEVLGKANQREMGIFRIFSHFTTEDSYYKAMFWSPVSSATEIEGKINDINSKLTFKISMRKKHFQFKPPTNIIQNGFLRVFQNIVNIYGIPRYRELNPAIYTAVTLPMQFGVMFGDLGHGKSNEKIFSKKQKFKKIIKF